MTDLLEIESTWDWYDAPICGVARIGDRRLYYTWTDEAPFERDGRSFKRRIYTAYDLDDATWTILEGDRVVEREDDAVRQIHDRLEEDPGILAFASDSLPFPSPVWEDL